MNDADKEAFKAKFRKGMQKLRERKESREKDPVNPLWPAGLLYGETPRLNIKGTESYRNRKLNKGEKI